MARGVEQRELHVRGFDHRRFGEDCDAALTFDLIRVEERVAVIDAAELTRDAGVVEERFGQRGFAGIHMCHNACHNPLHIAPHFAQSLPTPAYART